MTTKQEGETNPILTARIGEYFLPFADETQFRVTSLTRAARQPFCSMLSKRIVFCGLTGTLELISDVGDGFYENFFLPEARSPYTTPLGKVKLEVVRSGSRTRVSSLPLGPLYEFVAHSLEQAEVIAGYVLQTTYGEAVYYSGFLNRLTKSASIVELEQSGEIEIDVTQDVDPLGEPVNIHLPSRLEPLRGIGMRFIDRSSAPREVRQYMKDTDDRVAQRHER